MVHGEPVGYPIPLLSFSLLKFPEGELAEIRIESWSDAARTLQVRGFTVNSLLSHDHVTNSNRSVATTSFSIPDAPIMMQVRASAAGVKRGQCYVRVSLLMGGFPITCLFQNYVADDLIPCFPVMHSQGPTEGPGRIYFPTVANPAAGASVTITVPTNTRWRVLSVSCTFQSSAVAANRRADIFINASPTVIWSRAAGANITASQTRDVIWTPGYPLAETVYDANGAIRLQLPLYIYLVDGDTILILFDAIDATDQISNIAVEVEEWIEE